MGKSLISLKPLASSDREQFIADNQEAFNYGAVQEFGMRDDHEEHPFLCKPLWVPYR